MSNEVETARSRAYDELNAIAGVTAPFKTNDRNAATLNTIIRVRTA